MQASECYARFKQALVILWLHFGGHIVDETGGLLLRKKSLWPESLAASVSH